MVERTTQRDSVAPHDIPEAAAGLLGARNGRREDATRADARINDARPKITDPSKTAKDAAANRRTMGRYRVAIIIWRTHHSRQIARVAPSNVGTRAPGAYAILSPASRTACDRTQASLSTPRHRSASRKTGRWSRRTAHEPPQAKARRGSNRPFPLTPFHSVRTRDQNVGRGGTYQRNPVATPTVESARGWTS